MKTLVLLRGVAGSGKSTFVKNNGLETYTIEVDRIRLLLGSPVLTKDGHCTINQTTQKEAWNLVYSTLETRMKKGAFTVIDACHLLKSDLNSYKKLAEEYRYKVICVDFTDTPMELILRRNEMRALNTPHKYIPNYVLEKQYNQIESTPSYITVIKPEDFLNETQVNPIDLSSYKKIHHIGDIHGCNTALQEYLKDGLKEDEYYIFTGDYCDRGIENSEVLSYLFTIIDEPNVSLLSGNHEIHLWSHANDKPIRSNLFNAYTKPELEAGKIGKSDIRRFYRKLRQLVYYTYNEKTVLVTHGGISTLPYNLAYISTNQLTDGVGTYPDMKEVNDTFMHTTPINTYQIHGHRNQENLPIQINERCFCLEGQVEFGGSLRVVTLDKNGFTPIEVKNTVYRKSDKLDIKNVNPLMLMKIDKENIIPILRENEYIKENKQNHISSFNFTREAFRGSIWDEQTIRARGLFMNNITNDIVIRSYNKFFNINETKETKFKNLVNNLAFPVKVYTKLNGYLGLVSYDSTTDSLLIASKSSTKSDHAKWLKDMMYTRFTREKMEYLKNFTKENNCTLVFEVIAPTQDSHIIEYLEDDLLLLDIVYNELEFRKVPFKEMIAEAHMLGVDTKELATTLNTREEFEMWYKGILHHTYKYKDNYIEGFVLEDENQFMTKVKTSYYSTWKHMRNIKDKLYRENSIDHKALNSKTIPFYQYLLSLPKEELKKSIIEIRNDYERVLSNVNNNQ